MFDIDFVFMFFSYFSLIATSRSFTLTSFSITLKGGERNGGGHEALTPHSERAQTVKICAEMGKIFRSRCDISSFT